VSRKRRWLFFFLHGKLDVVMDSVQVVEKVPSLLVLRGSCAAQSIDTFSNSSVKKPVITRDGDDPIATLSLGTGTKVWGNEDFVL
jgi:hypothetical protein